MSAAEPGAALKTNPAARRQPGPQRRIAIIFAVSGTIGFALFAVLFGLVDNADTVTQRGYSGAAFALICALGLVWLLIQQIIVRPSLRLAAEARLVAEAKSDAPMSLRAYRALGPLPEAVAQLAGQLIAAQREIQNSVTAATRRVEEQKERLEAILRDLSEGVLVCNLEHHILLYNQVALSLLHVSGELGLGRSLFQLVTREPVLHGLQRLTQRPDASHGDEATIPVVCATTDSRTLLSGRMSLVLDAAQQPTGYVLTFTDATRSIAELSQRDTLLRNATEGLRQPIANLRAAAETISSFPEIAATDRRAFEEVILREGNVLSERLEALDHDYRSLNASHWPMADIHSSTCSTASCAAWKKPAAPPSPWWACRSGSMATAIPWPSPSSGFLANLADHERHRARSMSRRCWATGASMSRSRGRGSRSPPQRLMRGAPNNCPARSARATLARRAGPPRQRDVEPQRPARTRRAARSAARPARGVQFVPPPRQACRARPEFYDFDLLRLTPWSSRRAEAARPRLCRVRHRDDRAEALRKATRSSRSAPSAIVNGRILTGETFSRLVNPRRPIPARLDPASTASPTRWLRDAPPIEVVLPQFRAFVGDVRAGRAQRRVRPQVPEAEGERVRHAVRQCRRSTPC